MNQTRRLSVFVALVSTVLAVAPASPQSDGPPKDAAPKTVAPPPRSPAATLEDTAWKLTHLGEEPVAAAPTTRAAGLQFHGAERRVSGSTGCNRLSGRYKHSGDSLSFEPLATTRMLCPDAIDLESRFLAALGKVAKYRIVDSKLELLDTTGRLLARLSA